MKAFWKWLIYISALAILTGCKTFPKESDFTNCEFDAVEMESVTIDKNANSVFSTADLDSLLSNVRECESAPNYFDVLSISGGGADGAFGAGFMSAYIENHPLSGNDSFHPCIVTGISTGAVMGSYVFLATSKNEETRIVYLEKLKKFYQGLDDINLVKKNSILGLAFSVSQYEVDGLKKTIPQLFDETLLNAMRKEYQNYHRRFLVGATNLYTGRFEVIDLTKFVSMIDPAKNEVRICYGEAIRASAAIPVTFPPVPIKDSLSKNPSKLYVDGGIRHLMFINAALLDDIAKYKNPKQNKLQFRVYGVINNTFSIPSVFDNNLMGFALRNVAVVGDQLYKDSAYIVDSVATHLNNAQTYWANAEFVGDYCDSKKEGKLFNPPYQVCLFDIGKKNPVWSISPVKVETFQ